MANILFVEKKLRTDKLGILYLSAILKKHGHLVDMIQDDIDDVDSYLLQNKVDFIMYSVVTGDHFWFIRKNHELKLKYDFISVMGGPHFTYFPEDAVGDAIDYCVQGPGEEIILNIVEKRPDEKYQFGHIPDDINEVPAPDRSILYKYDEFGKSRMKRFIAGRDCPHACKYCFNHLYHKLYFKEKHKFFQITNSNKMIEEITKVRKDYGLELVYFNDDDLTYNHKWIEEFCIKFKKKINLPFCGSVRADSVNFEILEMMANAGCNFLNIALESANPNTQRLLRRGNITNKQIKNTCLMAESLGIKIRLQNMIGLPVEDPLEDALETLEFNQKLGITDSWVAIFQPFPKTDLWKYSIEKGFITGEEKAKKFYEETILKFSDAEKINRLHKWWYFVVKHKFPKKLVNILLKQPLDKKVASEMQDLRWEIGANILYGM